MPLDGRRPHILCIDHSSDILELLRDLLEDEGYRVSTLVSEERDMQAIAELEPDVVTIDYMWTTSDNEWTFLTMMTMDPRTRHIPVVLCTGAVAQVTEMEQHLATIGVTVVLKPFDIDALLQAVQEAVERRPEAKSSVSADT